MKSKMKVLKRIGIAIGVILILLTALVAAFITFSPQFGGTVSEEQKVSYAKTGHYEDDVFINKEPIVMDLNCHSITAMLRDMFNPHPNLVPQKDVKVQKIDPESLMNYSDTTTRITWLGHSSFLIQISGKTLLLDPIFSQHAAPHPWLGRERFNSEMPISLDEIKHVDAIIISHDHYDHLDYPSIKMLKDMTDHFFVPLGVGNHLRRWEINQQRITEMDWWQEVEYEKLKIVFTPSRHMSGRGLTDQSSTLWGSWIIQSNDKNIYFSGDGGYGDHFAEIGEKYGPFDIGLMECGQYNENWSHVHMMPEQTVQAGQDVNAELIVPIHWGAFTLAPHSWTDPIERFTSEADSINLNYATPRMGESIVIGYKNVPKSRWWERY